MAYARETIVRYRSSGHVRIQLPAAICEPDVADRLAAALREVEGIYRVDLSTRQRKLSIRFQEHICDANAVIQTLSERVAAVETEIPPDRAQPPEGLKSAWANGKRGGTVKSLVRWLQGKWQEARETVLAMRILARREAVQRRARDVLTEENVIFLLNDVVAVYLVRLHWPLITQLWIRQPWLYRYEWMATGYMVYLFVRSRRTSG